MKHRLINMIQNLKFQMIQTGFLILFLHLTRQIGLQLQYPLYMIQKRIEERLVS